MNKRALFIVSFFLVLVLTGLLLWQQQPKTYRLEVLNSSEVTVDQVRLFGAALLAEVVVKDLAVGESAILEAALINPGGLNFEVTQGFNRIDTFISQDVSGIDQFHQKLIINSNNRYIISD